MSRPIDYPEGWEVFAAQVKKEMGWRCERCKHVHDPAAGYCLTVHHLTNDKQQPFADRWAFAALCQRCHLTVQARVKMDQLFFDEVISVSDWFKPHLDGYLKAQERARALKAAEVAGTHGKAWRRSSRPPVVAHWIVERRDAHPFWFIYSVGVIHLRDMEGSPPAVVNAPGMTHEVFVYAIDPAWRLDLTDPPRILQPVNYVGQFREASDGLAERRVADAVAELLNGTLSPDTDCLREWVKRFGSVCIKPEYL